MKKLTIEQQEQLTPLELYHHDLAKEGFSHDPAQEEAVQHLQRLYDDLLNHKPVKGLKKLKKAIRGKKPEPVKGLYFWGGVGRGKTYLVDTFYNALPIKEKWRVHFHRFMQRIHNEMKTLEKRSDPLSIIAEKIAAEARVICFDEFFVSDITDAMILGTLFEELFKRQVTLVATSNIIPDELYKNGLQRARFLPAIKLINEHCEVVNVDGGVDYRMRTLTQVEIYHYPLDEDADNNLIDYFNQLSPDNQAHTTDKAVEINGREIPTRMESDDVILFDFRAICGGPRSQNDYIELSRLYHAVLISDVFQMQEKHEDIARRFIALVDEFYEHKVKLILSAEVPMDELYAGKQLRFEFRRCLSRLQEMQSREYLELGHNP